MKTKWFLIIIVIWVNVVAEAVLFIDYIAHRKIVRSYNGKMTKHEVSDKSDTFDLPFTPENVKKVYNSMAPKDSLFPSLSEKQIHKFLAEIQCRANDTLFFYIQPGKFSLSVASYENTHTQLYTSPHLWQTHYNKHSEINEIPSYIVNQTIKCEHSHDKDKTFLLIRMALSNDTIRTATSHVEWLY